jgi:hypothetical protein
VNATETAKICDAISQIKPAQKMDEETPAFWSLILADVRYEDARLALINLAKRDKFIDPSDIITEVKAMRRERLASSDLLLPEVDPDDVQGWLEARRRGIAALANGEIGPPKAIGAPQDPRVARAIPHVWSRPPKLLAITAEGGERPKAQAPAPKATIDPAAAERAEAERVRALDALTKMIQSDPPESGESTAEEAAS